MGKVARVRLPAELVRELGLREKHDIELRADMGGLAVRRRPRPEEILADLRRFRGRLPAEERLSRGDAHAR